jgi:ribosomal protein S18 acetylase RimI-like enzyme
MRPLHRRRLSLPTARVPPHPAPGLWVGGELVAVVQTVRSPSMDDAPSCAWLIEVFTDPQRRRTGLARSVVAAACEVIDAAGEHQVGLTVDDDNRAALTLYRSLGFAEPR